MDRTLNINVRTYRVMLHEGTIEQVRRSSSALAATNIEASPTHTVMTTLYRLGGFCGRNPWRVSFLALLTSACLCLGLRSVVIQSDPQKLWVPPDSVAAHEQTNFNELFGPFFRIQQLIFYVETETTTVTSLQASDSTRDGHGDDQAPPANNGLINRESLLTLADIQLAIQDATTTVDGHIYSLEDFCYRPIHGKGCLVTSPFQYWLGNRTLLAHDPDIKLTTACQTTDPILKDRSPCMDQNGIPVMRNVVFGGLSSDPCHLNPDPCGESTPSAKALLVTFLLQNRPENETYTQAVEAWEQDVFLHLAATHANKLEAVAQTPLSTKMKLTYMAQRSVADSLQVQTSQNAFIVAVSYFVMFLYVSTSLGKFTHPIHSRFGLGFTGIVVVLLSLGVSMGICCAWFQMEVTMITLEVVPFLLLAIGVDNMFILTNEFDRLAALKGIGFVGGSSQYQQQQQFRFRRGENEKLMLSQIMSETMATVGPSITVAAISECLAFLVGALTRIPALTTFCVVAAVAVVVNYALQLTWFASALVLDTRRARSRRYDLFPWVKQTLCLSPEKQHRQQSSASSSSSSSNGETGGVVKHFVEKTYIPFIMRKTTKLLVLLTTLCLMLVSLCGARHIPLGLEQELAVPTDFYLHEYFRVQTKYGEAGPPAYLVLGDGVDYTNATTQMEINHLMDDFASIRQYIQLPIYSWLDTFNQWRQMRYFLKDKIDDGSCDCPKQPMDPFPYEVLKKNDMEDIIRSSVFEQNLLSVSSSSGNVTPNALFYPLVQNFSKISIDSQCCQNFGLCGEQYEGDLVFHYGQGDEDIQGDAATAATGLRGSRFRFQINALKNQSMFINSYYYLHKITSKWQPHFGKAKVFPYTLFFVYYEQYSYIQGIAIQSILLALLVVFGAIFVLMDRNLRLSVIVTFCVLSMTLSQLGFVFLWNRMPFTTISTSMNAITVVNLLACVGLGVEFCIHMTHQFLFSQQNKMGLTGDDHTKHALSSVGASIISGITLTKFCGIGVLAFAPSMLFRVYFFRMYMGIVVLGFFHGMVLLPVLLSLFGIASSYPNDFSTFLLSEEQDEEDDDLDDPTNAEY